MPDDEAFQPWSDLPPGSHVWFVGQARGPEVVAIRGAVVTALGDVITLGPDVELRLDGWSTRPPRN
jgi:hypothetical protein